MRGRRRRRIRTAHRPTPPTASGPNARRPTCTSHSRTLRTSALCIRFPSPSTVAIGRRPSRCRSLAQTATAALVAGGVVAPEAAGRALLAICMFRAGCPSRPSPASCRSCSIGRNAPRPRSHAALAHPARCLVRGRRRAAAVKFRLPGRRLPRHCRTRARASRATPSAKLTLGPTALHDLRRAQAARLRAARWSTKRRGDAVPGRSPQQRRNASNSAAVALLVVVTEQETRAKLADCYRTGWPAYRREIDERAREATDTPVLDSAQYLADRFHEVPVMVAAVPPPARRQRAVGPSGRSLRLRHPGRLELSAGRARARARHVLDDAAPAPRARCRGGARHPVRPRAAGGADHGRLHARDRVQAAAAGSRSSASCATSAGADAFVTPAAGHVTLLPGSLPA